MAGGAGRDTMTGRDTHRRRWSELEEILDALLDLPPDRRAARLAERCRGDAELEAAARRLLAACEVDDDFLAAGPAAALPRRNGAPAGPPAAGSDPFRGRRLGAWTLDERLGEGGMGVVYRAHRHDGAFRQEAAVKLAPGVLLSDELRQRFEGERQLLARLRHPHVARLLDGGTTADGIPYLVTELVDGEPVDRHCERRGLGLADRLRLLLQVCAAVDYLHRHLVVHRDLKPSNILVDRDGRAVLLDFGIAKLLAGDAASDTTRTGRQPLTPGWAAPEQLAGEPVTTAVDVYALGALLRRLLVGPGDPREEVAREWRRPSDVAAPGLARRLRGDLDAVAMTALAAEPTDRYSSAAELAADLRRHLEGRPVHARPPSAVYRLGRLVRRHRVASALAAGLAATLVAGSAVVMAEAGTARHERDAARREGRRAERTAAFLEGLTEDADPFGDSGRELTARQLLERGARRVDRLPGDAATRAALLASLGRSLQHLGESAAAADLHRRALALRQRHFGLTSREASTSMADLAASLAALGRPAVAVGLLRPAIANLRWTAPRSWPLADALNTLAVLQLDQPRAASQLLREALALTDSVDGSHPGFCATVLNNLSICEDHAGHQDRSLALLRRAIAEERRVYGDRHPNLARMESNLGIRLEAAGELDAAENAFGRAIGILGRCVAADHPALVEPLTSLGHLLLAEGRTAAAAAPVERAAAIATSRLAPASFQRLAAEANRASLQLARGDLARAERAYRDLLQRMAAAAGPHHPGTARLRSLLGETLRREGRLDAAEPLLRAALVDQRGGAVRATARAATLESLAELLRASGRDAEGRRLQSAAADLAPRPETRSPSAVPS